MKDDNILYGIFLMLAFCILAPIGDALAKSLITKTTLITLIFSRFFVQTLLMTPITLALRKPFDFSAKTLALCTLRVSLMIAAMMAMIVALRYMALADAISIAFIMPFFVLILSHFIMKESIAKRQVLACAIGFVCALLVIQPAFVTIGWAAIFPVLAAFLFAAFLIVTRKIAKTVDAFALQSVTGVIGLALIVPTLCLAHVSELNKISITFGFLTDPSLFLFLVIFGLNSSLAQLALILSLKYAPGSKTVSLQYLEIPIAVLIGIFVFSEVPNLSALIGMCLIAGAGLLSLLKQEAKRPSAPTQLKQPQHSLRARNTASSKTLA